MNYGESDNKIHTFIKAAADGNLRLLKEFIDSGIDINMFDPHEPLTALMAASLVGQLSVVELLLANGANPNIKDEDGCTAIDYAQHDNHLKVIERIKRAIRESC